MCRSSAEGGRRCPGSRAGSGTSPPADGRTRIEVHTNRRSYSVIGGESRVTWMPGEKIVSMDVIDPSAGHAGDPDREAYEERAKELRDRVAAGETATEVLAARHAETSMRLLERALRLDREDRGEL